MDGPRSTLPPPTPSGRDSIASRIRAELTAVHMLLSGEAQRSRAVTEELEELLQTGVRRGRRTRQNRK